MADKAHFLTDRELVKIERHLSAIYDRAGKEVGEAWKAYLVKVDAEIKPLQEAYEAAKASGDREAIKRAGRKLSAVKREKTIMDAHYRKLTEQLAEEISHINATAAAYINGKLPEIYALNYNLTSEGIAAAVHGYSFELVDAATVKYLATTDETLLPYKYVDSRKDVRWNTQRVNSEVLQGIIQGDSIPNIAKRLESVTDMDFASAVRNARTAVTGAENRGRIDSLHEAQEKGVIVRKVWTAAHDARTREAHAALDGQDAEVDEPFSSMLGKIMYPGDPDAIPANTYNCRCTLTYKVTGFRHGD